MIIFRQLSDQPVLRPKTNTAWEADADFIYTAIYANDHVHLSYRTTVIASNNREGASTIDINELRFV